MPSGRQDWEKAKWLNKITEKTNVIFFMDSLFGMAS